MGSIQSLGKRISVSERAFFRVICRVGMKTVRRSSDLDVNCRRPLQGKSHPVQVKEPYGNLKWLLVGFHPATRRVQCTLSVSSKAVKT